ncbi:hypothetical protein MOQ72_22025 [Saccharopolyspora sp. K220]|uniref:hypothetical protein n=1 Tax=Saccharopolyspora soli TaxID=2926618 RepID=UPI001F580A66|nr:hypothetical protein [Saccharopolyspora soli]MCI2420125.1 hypothetical protein [Saccharopolyspora soli]
MTTTRLVNTGRAVAFVLSLATFGFLFVHGSWRADNLFLIPDLIICALLVVAAVLPVATASPALVFAFGMSAGVFTTATAAYAVRGEVGIATLVGAAASALMAWLLVAHQPGSRAA